jgi:ABC-type branched-subunit amino acid transport system ATPase component
MTAAVAIDNLAKVFGGLRAVDGVSLQVAPGERRHADRLWGHRWPSRH